MVPPRQQVDSGSQDTVRWDMQLFQETFFFQTYTAIKIERYPYTGGGGTIIRANEVAIHLILLGRVDIGKLERLGIWASWGD